jgi:hypothetical protein
MRKSTLFISASLTTFVLVVLAGVVSVSAYQAAINKTDASASQSQAQTQQQPVSVDLVPTAVAGQATVLTPEQSAQMAAQVIGRTDLYSVETSTWNGEQAYLVTFSSGDLVYVSPNGQILSISRLQTFSTGAPSGGGNGGGHRDDNGGSDGGGSGGEHESSSHEGGDD